jgi:ferrous iron transport protein A
MKKLTSASSEGASARRDAAAGENPRLSGENTRIAGENPRLGALYKGARAEIIGLDETGVLTPLLEGELELRLIEMGLVEGACIEVLHEGFPGRDPIAVQVNDHIVALRRSEANAVIVRLLDGEKEA